VASPSPEKPKPEKSSSALPIALFAGAGAFAGGAVVTGILASGAYRDLKEARARSPADQEKLGDLRRTTKSLALATDILGGSAILLGVVGLYLTLTPSKPRSTAALSPSVKLRLTLTSVGLEGRF
jgi:hypothetical protein